LDNSTNNLFQLDWPEMYGSWNFWVRVSPQIVTKDPLSVRVRNKRKILDPRLHWIGLPLVIIT